jgi:hypothetical protein
MPTSSNRRTRKRLRSRYAVDHSLQGARSGSSVLRYSRSRSLPREAVLRPELSEELLGAPAAGRLARSGHSHCGVITRPSLPKPGGPRR